MHNPENADSVQPPSAIPVETLIESLKPEQPLLMDDAYGSGGGNSGAAPH